MPKFESFITPPPVKVAPGLTKPGFSIDLSTHNSAIAIVLLLDLLFFIATVASAMLPSLVSFSARLWELFMATNAALFLALSVGSNPPPTPPGPTAVGA